MTLIFLPVATALVGHVGDGNFHTLILFDEKNPEEVRQKDLLYNRMIERALKAEGTCTGEVCLVDSFLKNHQEIHNFPLFF